MDSNNKYFRAGVGSVIYNEQHQVAVFKRMAPPAGIWQFQQGGIDEGEDLETTLWRELYEEVGLQKDDITKVTLYDRWTVMEYPPEITDHADNPNPNRLGQAHRWFFLQLMNGVEIDLTKATDQEFSDHRWVNFSETFTFTSAYRRPIYDELHSFFTKTVVAEDSE